MHLKCQRVPFQVPTLSENVQREGQFRLPHARPYQLSASEMPFMREEFQK